jgi:hypothetical protein
MRGPDDEVLDLLTRLVDKSMVVAEGGASGIEGYRLLEPSAGGAERP